MSKGKANVGAKHMGTAAMSQREVGELFGVTLQSVQQVEYRAIKKIREAIKTEAAAAGITPRQWLFGED